MEGVVLVAGTLKGICGALVHTIRGDRWERGRLARKVRKPQAVSVVEILERFESLSALDAGGTPVLPGVLGLCSRLNDKVSSSSKTKIN
jgi:hypothetical protein